MRRIVLRKGRRRNTGKESSVGMHWVDTFDGQRLARLRRDRGLSQQQLAEAVYRVENGDAQPPPTTAETVRRVLTVSLAISAYESGSRRPRGAALHHLAAALDVDVLDLLADGVQPSLPLLRARLGLSQGDVAAALGVSRPAYAHVEQGRRSLSDDEVGRLAGALQVDVARLRQAAGQAVPAT